MKCANQSLDFLLVSTAITVKYPAYKIKPELLGCVESGEWIEESRNCSYRACSNRTALSEIEYEDCPMPYVGEIGRKCILERDVAFLGTPDMSQCRLRGCRSGG